MNAARLRILGEGEFENEWKRLFGCSSSLDWSSPDCDCGCSGVCAFDLVSSATDCCCRVVAEDSPLRRFVRLGLEVAGTGCLLGDELNGRVKDCTLPEAGDSSLLMHCWHTDLEAIL